MDLFSLTSNKFRMVYKIDGNPQLDSRDWSIYLKKVKTQRAVSVMMCTATVKGLAKFMSYMGPVQFEN